MCHQVLFQRSQATMFMTIKAVMLQIVQPHAMCLHRAMSAHCHAICRARTSASPGASLREGSSMSSSSSFWYRSAVTGVQGSRTTLILVLPSGQVQCTCAMQREQSLQTTAGFGASCGHRCSIGGCTFGALELLAAHVLPHSVQRLAQQLACQRAVELVPASACSRPSQWETQRHLHNH